MATLILITGTHNAGKSTLAKLLAKSIAMPVFSELGGDLRKKATCSSWNSCEVFDELVMFREFERDHIVFQSASKHGYVILEQWHIGNLAHTSIRSPNVGLEYKKRLKPYLSSLQAKLYSINIQVSPKEIIRREKILPSADEIKSMMVFYTRLSTELETIYQYFGINYININGEQSSDKVLTEVLNNNTFTL